MIIILKPGTGEDELTPILDLLRAKNITVQNIPGETTPILKLDGDTAQVSGDALMGYNCIEHVLRVQETYKLAGRRRHPQDSVIELNGQKIGGGNFAVIAGPCSVEDGEQIQSIAREVKAAGANFLRGGAFKPRTSPYSFSGLGLAGLELLKTAGQKTGLPIVSELMSEEFLDNFARDVDVIQIGARNMQNFSLLRRVGQLKKPVLLKRSPSATIEELLMAAEHLMAGGADEVILCERGIRTFETATRNTLDLSAIPVLQSKSHLPVVVDPSHATGNRRLVEPLALAAVACGADGLMIEVHNCPQNALSDGAQSITPADFRKLMEKTRRIREAGI